jgi:twitching motility protein PilI
MARKTSLREFQQRVAERLRDLSSRKTVASKLGFQVGGDNWLVNLADVSEVIPVPYFFPVPQTQNWFRGVSNIRGKLYSTIDFAAFQGGSATGQGMERRVVLIHDRIIDGSGLLVSRMLGLRNPETFSVEESPEDKPWVAARYRDSAGVLWLELDVPALAREPRFLEVGLVGALASA